MNDTLVYEQYRSVGEINDAMIRVYNNMALAVVNSMLVSYVISSSPALMAFLFTGLMKWIVIFAPIAAVFVVGYFIDKVSKSGALMLLHAFAALMGMSFSMIFVVYTMGSIVTAFMGAALFGTLSLYGYFTKRSLESMGQFLFVGLIAVIIASIVNIFIGSSIMQMVISAVSIIIFLGLTAYDTQQIRIAVSVDSNGNEEVMGALTLYLDFINIFINLLQLFGIGGKKDD
jgi:FtsH-binding integral membrane protein